MLQPLPAVCAGTSVARGRPGAQEMSLCSSRWHSSFESTLKPTCSRVLLKVAFCGYRADILTTSNPETFQVGGFLLFSPNIQLLNTGVKWSSGLEGSTFSMVLPATMLDAQGAVGVCAVVWILCPAPLSYPGQVCTQVWRTMTPDSLPAAQILITDIFIAIRVDSVPQPKPRDLMFVWTISDMLGSTFINQASLKVSVTHKAFQELLGQDFGNGPRQSLSPNLSSLPQTFRSFSAQCPVHHFCQIYKAHLWFLLQNSNGTRQEARQRNRTEALRENVKIQTD